MQLRDADSGSYRDPSGHIYEVDGRILRTVAERAREDYEAVRDAGIFRKYADKGWLIEAGEVPLESLGAPLPDVAYVLEHPRLHFVSYPYEWCFAALKDAALLHLDLQLELLNEGFTLSDASAYNVQFRGPRPVFIDTLSLRRYHQGEFWLGHRQFCEQFLNPLLLRALVGVTHNNWYRGNLEGIGTADLARVLPLRSRLSLNVITQVLLQARLEANAIKKPGEAIGRLHGRSLSTNAYKGLLSQMRRWIAKLRPADTGQTIWQNYAKNHTYSDDEAGEKRGFIASFVNGVNPRLLWDIGCNTGDYSSVALESGVENVVGFDFDHRAVEIAYARAKDQNLNLLPLWLDAANPSPSQGWRGLERKSLADRAKPDAIIALAFEHHLAIGRNIPLDQVVEWLVSLAPTGVIEFVQKSDPTVQQMLALRADIFDLYEEDAFKAALADRARIIEIKSTSAHGRRLYWFDRR